MTAQLAGLSLVEGATVIDIGSGAGAFPVQLGSHPEVGRLRVVEVDLVHEGLCRARRRVRQGYCGDHDFSFVSANLDKGAGGVGLPFGAGTADAILASLVLNYLAQPAALLREAARVLRTGGRLVVSGMKPDADVSKICVAGVAELRSGEARSVWGDEDSAYVDGALQEFISSGARLLDLEEAGTFRFWDAEELRAMVGQRFFRVAAVLRAYGEPPQALVVVAERTQEPVD
jgi:ubiquinone/menaquinone biosynthesis C-methylase UbiE